MKLSCEIIRDLLPLYAEELASTDSKAAVREHLEDCESCRISYEEMKKSPVIVPEKPGLVTVRREIWKQRILTALCAVLVFGMLGCWGLSWLRMPIYLDESIVTSIEPISEFQAEVTLDAAVVGEPTFQFEIENDTITTWTSRWLRMKWNGPEPRKTEFYAIIGYDGIYYFTGVDGEENILIYENPKQYLGGGTQTLPRLYLNFYFQASLTAGAVLLLLALLLRKKRAGKWIGAIGTLALCYGLCQGIVCGFTFASFFAEKELFWGLSMGVCMWGALMCLWGMRRKA